MKPQWRGALSILLVVCGSYASDAAEEPASAPGLTRAPQWIWSADAEPQPRFIRRISLPRSILSAQLKFAADFCAATIEINGQVALTVEPYCQLQTLDVTPWLVRGDNEIVIRARRVPGPAAVALSLLVTHHEGQPTVALTDDSWGAVDLGAVPAEQWGVGRRGIELSPFENYEQWQQAKTDGRKQTAPKFWTAPGFTVTELRSAAADEGSWISLSFDPQGRLVISREDEGMLRMTLNEDRTTVAKVEPIRASVKECRGLVWNGNDLFAQANNSLALFGLEFDAAGNLQQQRALRQLPGKVGHGRNDLALFGTGADRRLYAICGDSVDLPREAIADFTSPLNETKRRGPGREGFLLRGDVARGSDSTGKWELLSAGLRNPYGIALDRGGEAFTFDADNEFDMGTPWYRPTRILHLLPGGDTGYRESTGRFPPRFHDQPDHAPPLLDIGRSSPTSVMFGYDLQAPRVYREALYALDWTYGRVLAIHLAPRGATYRAAAELFLQGRPLNVTDVATGPDGAMYLITGGRKTQSALYRVHFAGAVSEDTPEGKHEQQAREYSVQVRKGERSLLHPTLAKAELQARVPAEALTVADPVLRHAARIAWERKPLDEWRAAALESKPVNLFALLALARARRTEDAPAILESLLRASFADADLTQRFVWVRIAELCRETSPADVAAQASSLRQPLVQWWRKQANANQPRAVHVSPEGSAAALRRKVALLLGELQAEESPALAASLFTSPVQEDQLAGLLATRQCTAGWTEATRRQQLQALRDMAHMVAGAGLPPFESWLRPQIEQTLAPAERATFAELLKPAASDAAEPLPPPRDLVQKWTLAELATLHAPDAPAGDAAKGAEIFRAALCIRCHRVGARGAAVGPDLTHVTRRFSRRDLLESIVSPSLSVAENFRLETVLTQDGRVLTGRVLSAGDYRSEKLILATDPLRPELTVEVDKKEIAEHRPTQTSPMPNGLLDTFTRDEIRDLLAYLDAGR